LASLYSETEEAWNIGLARRAQADDHSCGCRRRRDSAKQRSFFTEAPAWLLACGLASAIPAASAG
jgi:hypothetical protein